MREPAAAERGAALIKTRSRRGDLGGFEEVYNARLRRLYGVAVRMLVDPADAEDVLQEICPRNPPGSWTAAAGKSALETSLYGFAANLCLDRLRNRTRHAIHMTDAARR